MTVVLNGSPVSLDGLLGYSKLQDLLTLIIGLLNDQGASLTQLQTDSDASRALVEKGLDEVREECKGHGSSLGGLASRMDELGGLASRMDELEKQAEQQKASQQELDKVRERLGAMEEQAKTLEGIAGELGSLGEKCSSLDERNASLQADLAAQGQRHEALEAAQRQHAAESANAEALERRVKELEANILDLQQRFMGFQAASDTRAQDAAGAGAAGSLVAAGAAGAGGVGAAGASGGAAGASGGAAGAAGGAAGADGAAGDSARRLEAGLQVVQASCQSAEQRIAALEDQLNALSSSAAGGAGASQAPAASAGSRASAGGRGAKAAAGGAHSADGAGGARGTGPAGGAAGAKGKKSTERGRLTSGGSSGSEVFEGGDRDNADEWNAIYWENRLGDLEARVDALAARGPPAGYGAGDVSPSGGPGTGGTREAGAAPGGAAGGPRQSSSATEGTGSKSSAEAKRRTRGANDAEGAGGEAASGQRGSTGFTPPMTQLEVHQLKKDSSEALANSRRLDRKVIELESLLQSDVQELRAKMQEAQASTEGLKGQTDEQSKTTSEARERLQRRLDMLEETLGSEVQPGLQSLTEKQASDILRLTREIKEIQAYLQAMAKSGASATARCLMCFSARYQEQTKFMMGVDGKVYKTRPKIDEGHQHSEGDIRATSPVPLGPGRTPAQGAPGAAMRKSRSGQINTSPAAAVAAEKRKNPAATPELPEVLEGSMLSTAGGQSWDNSRENPISGGESLDGIPELVR